MVLDIDYGGDQTNAGAGFQKIEIVKAISNLIMNFKGGSQMNFIYHSINRTRIWTVSTLVLLTIGFTITANSLENSWDLALWDEADYMSSGIYSWIWQFQDYEKSPLYSYFYHVLYQWVHSPIDLQYVAGIIGVTSSLLSLFFGIWYIGKNLLFATMAICFLMLSDFIMIIPRSVYPVVSIIIMGAMAAFSFKSLLTRSAIFSLTAFLVAFIRPEFTLSLYLFIAVWLYSLTMIIINRHATRSWFHIAFSTAIGFTIVYLSINWTFPIIHGGERALSAFGQHYAAYFANVTKGDTFLFFNSKSVLDSQFPGVQSEFQALLSNPWEMFRFFYYNLSNVLIRCLSVCIKAFNQYWIFLVIVGSACLVIVIKATEKEINHHKQVINSLSPTLLQDGILWSIMALPTVTAIVLIGCEPHYLILLTALLLCGLAIIIRHSNLPHIPFFAAIVAITFVLSVAPTNAQKNNLEIVRKLQSQGYLGLMLENDGFWCIYIPNQCVPRVAAAIPLGKSYMDYIDEEHIRSIVVSPMLIGLANLNNQHDFLNFISNPNPITWEKIELPSSTYLIKRKSDTIFMGTMLTNNLLRFISSIQLGDDFGNVTERGKMTLFIHPGRTLPTIFDLNIGSLAHDAGCKNIILTGKMDPDVPPDASTRGGAIVDMTLVQNKKPIFSKTVSMSMGTVFEIAPNPDEVISVIVGNHGNPDSDHFNLIIGFSGCN